ncbi:MAG TPA: L,D-transpeptidase/peptidoglycan binding protein [Acidimicrobiales bacterium]|nr:L,D-transpeptidase/peptidoglycan binding protein [Acidimicrobiales bacterium]
MSFIRRHPVLVISLVVATLMVSGATVWTVNYDSASSKKMLEDTVVGGVPVGGMRYQEAVRAVRAAVEDPLHRPIRVEAEDFGAETTAWDLGLQVDVPRAVRKAMDRSNEGNLLTRVWRRLFGAGPVRVDATPEWGQGDVSTLLSQAADAVKVEPKDAKVDASSGWVTVIPPKTGRELDLEKSRTAILDAANRRDSSVRLVTNTLEPKVGAGAVAKVILVRTGENMLYLYENGRIAKSWPVATGTAQFPTPTGTWRVVQKLVNPTWINPGSAWARNMPPKIGPGPNNPLGTRALALNASGILIHATSDRSSIGFSASHGCIRMSEEDEMDLFGRVEAGTMVAIVNAGPPKPRGSAPPPAAAPEQNAVVNF